jgi:hypothetical protein
MARGDMGETPAELKELLAGANVTIHDMGGALVITSTIVVTQGEIGPASTAGAAGKDGAAGAAGAAGAPGAAGAAGAAGATGAAEF